MALNGGIKPARDPALTWEIPDPIDEKDYYELEPAARAAFLDAAESHIDAIVTQLLKASNVPNSKLWKPLLSRLARDAAGFISLGALRNQGDFDLRNAIKVKKVLFPSGSLPQAGSSAVDGVVCHKNVAHKRMRTLIQNPRIITLSGALEQDAAQDKLSSIDALSMGASTDRLKKWIEHLAEIGPDVVLIEGSATRQAQEMLLEAGISLVTTVKAELLHRVARCVGSTVFPVGSRLEQASVGSCQIFEVFIPPRMEIETPEESPEPDPVMLFKGCARGLGASLVLQGSDMEELIRVKRVAQDTIYTALWNSVESAFLAHEFIAASALLKETGEHATRAQATAKESISSSSDARLDGPITSASPHCSVFGGVTAAVELEREIPTHAFARAQQLWLSISCRNPSKGLQCESPHLHSMPFYREGDLSLTDFLAAASPTNRKCPNPHCGDKAALHLRTFVHGDSLVTLSSVHLSPEKQLSGTSGEEDKTVWLWMRPLGRLQETANGDAVRRVPLGLDAARISFSHLLSLLLDARYLCIGGVSLQHDLVKYFGFGWTVFCLHHSVINPVDVRLPPALLCVAEEDRDKWLLQEVKSLIEEGDEIIGVMQKVLSTYDFSPNNSATCEEGIATLSHVRTTFMRAARNIPTGPFNSTPLITNSLESINRLRRQISILVKHWDDALLQSGTLLESRGDVVHTDHSRTSSSASSLQGPLPAAELTPSTTTSQQSYKAPKLIDASESGIQPKDHTETIPTGLVARYVSQFDNQDSQVAWTESTNVASFPRKFGPSTTIHLRGGSPDVTNRRTTSLDGALEEDLEEKVHRLGEIFSLLFIVEAERTGSEKTMQLPSLYSSVLGRPLLPNGVNASDSPVTIFDKEPSSLIAFFLTSKQYQAYIQQAKSDCLKGLEGTVDDSLDGLSSDEIVLLSPLQLDCQMLAEDESSPFATRAKFQMTAHYAPHFAILRDLCIEGGDAAFLISISRCAAWCAQGGKSNVYFAKTLDDRYIIKQLTKSEKQSVLEYAPQYFKYLRHCISNVDKKSCLAKILGIYQIHVEYANGSVGPIGKDGVMDFIIMENLFHGCDMTTIYDLKGSERDRYATEALQSKAVGPTVLLDENLRELIKTNPIFMTPAGFLSLQQALCDDTNFLALMGVMDYSLLVGLNVKQKELVVGLVDYVRQYTWDKQIESWVKKSGLLGGAGKEPTIISPQQYARRFRTAMLSYFTVVPYLGKPPEKDCIT